MNRPQPFRYSLIHLLLALGVGAALGYGAHALVKDLPEATTADLASASVASASMEPASIAPSAPAVDIEQLRKDLSTRFIGDPRTLGEKWRDFVSDNAVAENPVPQAVPLVCKVIADLAENPDALSNQELIELYPTQRDTDLQRVIAQVLSLRGDNQLLDDFVDNTLAELRGAAGKPGVAREALQTLAKTHYAGAAAAIVPLLQTEDTSLLLDALLALRATGNESHLPALEPLLNHADASVSWLAQDAYKQLQNLSTKARTHVVLADINAELPL